MTLLMALLLTFTAWTFAEETNMNASGKQMAQELTKGNMTIWRNHSVATSNSDPMFERKTWLRGTANSGLPAMFTNPRTNNGYHLDWCMSWAGDCGCPVAHSFCRRMRYREVGGFQITRSVRSVTQSLGSGQICVTGSTHQGCNGFQFIECIWQSLSLRFENKGNKACHTS